MGFEVSMYYNKSLGDPIPENEIELDWVKEYWKLHGEFKALESWQTKAIKLIDDWDVAHPTEHSLLCGTQVQKECDCQCEEQKRDFLELIEEAKK